MSFNSMSKPVINRADLQICFVYSKSSFNMPEVVVVIDDLL